MITETALRRRRCVIVQQGDRIVGIVTPKDVRTNDRTRWDHTTVFQVMRPLARITAVEPATPVSAALSIMSSEDVEQVPVVEDGRLEGMLTRAQIVQLLQSRAELKAA